jgi:prepilin signal peptidase PulO-like enzyme (type II secretory pathway)
MTAVFPGPVFWIFALFAVPISVIDFRYRRIPDALCLPCFCLLLLLRAGNGLETLPNFLAAALFGGLLFLAVRSLGRGLGLGDVKYAALLGLVCGFPGICSCLLAAAVLGLAAAPFFTRAKREAGIPFAPFLSAAGLLTALVFP